MTGSFDLARARRDTPACEHVLHFNNAGAALMPTPVADALVGHLELERRIGGYEAARAAAPALERAYDAAAALLGGARDEIAFVENATRAWDMAFYSIIFRPGDRILTSVSEYASNYIAYLQVARRTGASVEPIPNDESGQLSVAALRDMIDERVKLLSISHVPTNSGLVNPAAEVGAVAREAGVLYLLDACQSVGQMPVDVRAIGCDMLSFTGRKYLRGPRGTGMLWVRRERIAALEPPLLDFHAATWTGPDSFEIRADARRFENWERNFAGQVALGVAIDYALECGIDAIWQRIGALAGRLRDALADVPGVTVRDIGREQCGIVTFTVDGLEAEAMREALERDAINVAVSPPHSTLLDARRRGLPDVVRASVHAYNTDAEIERFRDAVAALGGR